MEMPSAMGDSQPARAAALGPTIKVQLQTDFIEGKDNVEERVISAAKFLCCREGDNYGGKNLGRSHLTNVNSDLCSGSSKACAGARPGAIDSQCQPAASCSTRQCPAVQRGEALIATRVRFRRNPITNIKHCVVGRGSENVPRRAKLVLSNGSCWACHRRTCRVWGWQRDKIARAEARHRHAGQTHRTSIIALPYRFVPSQTKVKMSRLLAPVESTGAVALGHLNTAFQVVMVRLPVAS